MDWHVHPGANRLALMSSWLFSHVQCKHTDLDTIAQHFDGAVGTLSFLLLIGCEGCLWTRSLFERVNIWCWELNKWDCSSTRAVARCSMLFLEIFDCQFNCQR